MNAAFLARIVEYERMRQASPVAIQAADARPARGTLGAYATRLPTHKSGFGRPGEANIRRGDGHE